MEVILKECKTYNDDIVTKQITSALNALHFDFSRFYNAKVAIKPNLLTSTAPEAAIVTHPLFFRAIVHVIKQHGGIPILVESPAVHSLQRVMKKAGYDTIVADEDIQVADTSDYIIIYNENARHFKYFEVPKIFTECDIIINLPKFKTHALTYITCAVKNFFGTIHGMKKSQWHIKAKTKSEFSEMLLDLYEAYITDSSLPKTIIHIVDAITILEGDGPGLNGNPKFMGIIGASYNAIAVDYALSKIAGFTIDEIPTITMGMKRNICAVSDAITIVKDAAIENNYNCIPPKESGSQSILSISIVNRLLKNMIIAKPLPDDNKCTLCYQCKQICPAKAISIAKNGKKIPNYNYSKCIRCYCCMEICPESAISLSQPWLQKLMR